MKRASRLPLETGRKPAAKPSQAAADPRYVRELVGQQVVVDLRSPWVYIGRWSAVEGEYLILTDVDAHDLRDTQTTREKYVLDRRVHGVHPNRKRTWVRLDEIVGFSRLEDVVVD